MNILTECSQCVSSKDGMSCCARGGSWSGRCGSAGHEFTWADGLKACAKQAQHRGNKTVPVPENQLEQSSPVSVNHNHDSMAPTITDQIISAAMKQVKKTKVTVVMLTGEDGRKSAESKLESSSANSESDAARTMTRSASICCLMYVFNVIRIG